MRESEKSNLVNSSNSSQETGFSGELLQSLVEGFDGGKRLIETRVDFTQVQVSVDHVLLFLC